MKRTMITLITLLLLAWCGKFAVADPATATSTNGGVGGITVNGNQNPISTSGATSASAASGGSVTTYDRLQAAGFFSLPGNAPLTRSLSPVFTISNLTIEQVNSAATGSDWKRRIGKIDFDGGNPISYGFGKLGKEVFFVFGKRSPSIRAKLIETGTVSINAKYGREDFLFVYLGSKSMRENGANVIVIDDQDDGYVSHTSGSALSAVVNFCTLGAITAAGGVSGSNTGVKKDRAIVRYAMYYLEDPVVNSQDNATSVSSNAEIPDPIKRIEELQKKIDACTDFCAGNLVLRKNMMEALIEAFQKSDYDERILRDGVIIGKKQIKGIEFQFELAKLNHDRGSDIAKNQQKADEAWKKCKFYYAGYLKIVRGKKFANNWAWKNGVEAVPSFKPDSK